MKMKKLTHQILFQIGQFIGWRWLSMIAGVALMAACSGKTDKAKVSTDNIKDSERVTCYEPVPLQDSAVPDTNVRNQGEVITQDSVPINNVPEKHTCYAWVESDL